LLFDLDAFAARALVLYQVEVEIGKSLDKRMRIDELNIKDIISQHVDRLRTIFERFLRNGMELLISSPCWHYLKQLGATFLLSKYWLFPPPHHHSLRYSSTTSGSHLTMYI